MKKILLLTETQEQQDYWTDVLSISTDFMIRGSLLKEQIKTQLVDVDFAIIINGEHSDTNEILELLSLITVPMILHTDIAKKFNTIAALLNLGVKGVVDSNLSVAQISELINIIEMGGIHISPKLINKVV